MGQKNDLEMHFILRHEIFRILRANNFDRWISNTVFAKKEG